jgi:hypothetical protein
MLKRLFQLQRPIARPMPAGFRPRDGTTRVRRRCRHLCGEIGANKQRAEQGTLVA